MKQNCYNCIYLTNHVDKNRCLHQQTPKFVIPGDASDCKYYESKNNASIAFMNGKVVGVLKEPLTFVTKKTHNCSQCQFLRETSSGRLRCTHIDLSIHHIYVDKDNIGCGLFMKRNKPFSISSKTKSQKVTPKKSTKIAQNKVGARKVKY